MKISIFLITLLISKSLFQITAKFKIQTLKPKEKRTSNFLSFYALDPIPSSSKLEGRTVINLCLGTPPQCFNLIIQTNSFFIWVIDSKQEKIPSTNKFNMDKSDTLIKNMTMTTLKYYHRKVEGLLGKDTLTIGNKKISNIDFLIATEIDFEDIDGMIGFGYTPNTNEKRYSFLEQLHNLKIIPHKVFTQKYNNLTEGDIFIGEIPEKIIKDYKHYGRCEALDKIKDGKRYKNKNWQCEINGIYIGKEYSNDKVSTLTNQKLSFLSYRKRTFVPLTLFEKIRDLIFSNLLSSKKCIQDKIKRYTLIQCDKDVEIDYFNLIFDNWILQIPGNKLFKEVGEKKEFIFYYKEKYEKFILGRSVLLVYEMVYDYANRQIGFYNPNDVKYIGKNEPQPPKQYFFIKDDPETSAQRTKNPNTNIFPTTKPEDNDEGNIQIQNSRKYTISYIIQTILAFIIIGVISIIILYVCYSYCKYKRKKCFKNIEYYQKQAEGLISNKFTG
jgi:hypothetical protein